MRTIYESIKTHNIIKEMKRLTFLLEHKMANNLHASIKHVIKRLNYKKLSLFIKKENWLDVLQCRDVDDYANLFVNKIKKNIDFTTEGKYLKSKERKLKPWITQGLLTSIRQRDKLK